MLFCVHAEEPASGSEEGVSRWIILKIFCLFVCSQLDVVSAWGKRCFTKSKF